MVLAFSLGCEPKDEKLDGEKEEKEFPNTFLRSVTLKILKRL
jgi:hypothetical protein